MNRAHLAAREEGLDRGVAIVLGEGGRRATILRRGHAENEGGGARVVSGERDGEGRTTMAQQTGARAAAVAPPMMARAIWGSWWPSWVPVPSEWPLSAL